jgi:hypothetical protein
VKITVLPRRGGQGRKGRGGAKGKGEGHEGHELAGTKGRAEEETEGT